MIQYEDFSIKIEPQREGVYPVIVLRSPAGEGRSSFRLPFDPDDLGDLLVDLGQAVRGSSPRPMREAAPGATRTRPQQVGDQLFNALFAGPARSLLDQSLGMIRERQKGLRIKLHIDPEDASLARLASLPWELMYRKETRDFLNLSRYTPILRYLDVQVPYIPLALEPPLRILIVISNPVDYARLNLEHERAQIERTWAQQENVEVSFLAMPTISALQDRLEREPFHALHYMGHGGFDRRSGSGVLFLEDGNGYGSPVDGRTLGVLLRDVPTLRLVFLNACETARVTKQVGLDPFAGVAAAIVMAGVPAVVAMQFPISDVAAIRFAGRFYPLIALGEPVDYAVAEGRRAIRVAEGDTMEWATPVLFMRAPDGVLFRVAEAQRVVRPRPQPPALDREQEQRLEELYISGLGAFWLEEWDRACHHFQEIVDERPDYKDAAARLAEAELKWHQSELYNQAQEARQAGSWTVALARLEELVAQDPGYKDAAALLEMAHRQRLLADLYGQARQLHQAGQWPAVVRVFEQIATLDPGFPDPDDLLATARQKAAEQERQAALNDLYRRAVLEMDAGRWEEAQRLLTRSLEQEPGYRDADRLLAKARAQILRLEEERRRQEQIAALYDQAVNRAGSGQWAQALAAMDGIRALDPDFDDPQGIAARARDEVERRDRLAALYAQARAAHDAQDWPQALAALQALLGEDAGYRDAAALLAAVEVQQEMSGLYDQARQQHQAGAWQAVVDTFARIAALEPGYADPEGLLPAAERSLAEEQRRAELDDRYTRAVEAMDAGQWAQAHALLAQIEEGEPGYRDVERLLDRVEAELEQAEAERQRQEQIATLYEQAQSLARARQWRQALAKLDEIHALDAGFADPEGIAARARERVAQEEAEAQRQNELAALYAEAVRLLKADQYQEALEKWGEVQALDPRYRDRKKVQATAKKRLVALAKPAGERRVPTWAWVTIGGALLVVVVAVLLLSGALGGGGTEPTRTVAPAVAMESAKETPTETPRPTHTQRPPTSAPADTPTPRPTSASAISFADADDFQRAIADLGTPTLIDFEDIDARPVSDTIKGRDPFKGSTYADRGISFSNPKGAALYVAPGGLPWNASNSLSIGAFPGDPNTDDNDDDLIVTLDPPVVAGGFTLIENDAADRDESVRFLDVHGDVIREVTPPLGYAFVGIVSVDRPIEVIRIEEARDDGDDVAYDDFFFIPGTTVGTDSTVSVPECAPGVLFCEGFEAGQAERWDLDPGWEVVQDKDNYVLRGSGHHWANLHNLQGYVWEDYRVRFRLRLEGSNVHTSFRNLHELGRGNVRYYLGFGEGWLALTKEVYNQHTLLADVDIPLTLNRWYDVEIVGFGGYLGIYVNGDLQLDYTDPEPLERGGISFETQDDSRAMVDDIEVRPAEEPAPPPTPTRTPNPPTPGPMPDNPNTGTVWEWSDGSAMVYVPAGTFWMGGDKNEPVVFDNQEPQHEVTLDALWIDRTEVTNAQYRRCVNDGACSPPSSSKSSTRDSYYGASEFDDYPVVYVDWEQASAYCAWIGKRLPTEAEWEKAARGIAGSRFPWGDEFDQEKCNSAEGGLGDTTAEGGLGDTTPVGRYSPGGDSAYGLADMAGNVWEWTRSLWGDDGAEPTFRYPYDAQDGREDAAASGWRVVRGGSWMVGQENVRAAYRNRDPPFNTYDILGFRCARSGSEP